MEGGRRARRSAAAAAGVNESGPSRTARPSNDGQSSSSFSLTSPSYRTEAKISLVVAPRKPKKKKARPTPTASPSAQPPPTSSSSPLNPIIPQPYLALAPTPISLTSPSSPSRPSTSHLILPSTYSRTYAPSPSPALALAAPIPERRGYAANLLAPPAIMPGGSALPPRAQPISSSARPRTSQELRNRRSRDRLRELGGGSGGVNASMLSLGHLGQIMESDPIDSGGAGATAAAAAAREERRERRRRRVVRDDADSGGLVRRLTVTTREEGRALGVARGASMRRRNVWDDVPENEDPPPAFPFPTHSNTRLPPTFETIQESSNPPAHPPTLRGTPAPIPIPNSPPPTFEQAIGLEPLPLPLMPSEAPMSPTLELPTPSRPADGGSAMGSPTSTRYMSATSSPVRSVLDLEDEEGGPAAEGGQEVGEEVEREDRKAWNEDLSAGFALEVRVRREMERRAGRDELGAEEEDAAQALRAGALVVSTAALPEAVRISKMRDEEQAAAMGSAEPVISGVTEPLESSRTPADEDQDGRAAAASLATSAGPSKAGPKERFESDTRHTAGAGPSAGASGKLEVGENRPSSEPAGSSPSLPNIAPLATSREPKSSAVPTATESGPPADSIAKATAEAVATAPPVGPKITPTPDSRPGADVDPHPQADPIYSAPSPEEPAPAEDPSPKPDEALTTPTPERKLTRGKAIRRSSSGLTASGQTVSPSSSPRLSKRLSVTSPLTPLFQESGEYFGRRLSDAPISVEPDQVKGGRRRSVDRSQDLWKSAKEIIPDEPTIPDADREKVDQEPKIPVHREAALLRRPLTIRRREPSLPPPLRPTPYTRPPPTVPAAVSGPLIDLTGFELPSLSEEKEKEGDNGVTLSGLARHTEELLALLEDRGGGGESSKQGAEREEIIRAIKEVSPPRAAPAPLPPLISPLGSRTNGESSAKEEKETVQSITERRAPPPPPPFRIKNRLNEYTPPSSADRPMRKLSILRTADSPIIPSRRRATSVSTTADQGEVAARAVTPTPTRRPPPPPPVPPQQGLATADESKSDSATPPPLPPRPPPPPFLYDRTAAQTMEKSHELKTPLLDSLGSVAASSTPNLNMRLAARPKGPRPAPPPVPRRPWAKPVGASQPELQTLGGGMRRLEGLGRSKSEGVVSRVDSAFTEADEDEVGESEGVDMGVGVVAGLRRSESGSRSDSGSGSGLRSDLGEGGSGGTRASGSREREDASPIAGRGAAAAAPRAVREYTDLDVLVSRLEGSGREYEGFSQITAFLGPSKSTAATPAALATLLPGLITVDSRRVTPQGKVKLKLSMLGVRVGACPICLRQFKDGERGVMLPKCGHVAHEGCAGRWWREEGRCFVCREPLE